MTEVLVGLAVILSIACTKCICDICGFRGLVALITLATIYSFHKKSHKIQGCVSARHSQVKSAKNPNIQPQSTNSAPNPHLKSGNEIPAQPSTDQKRSAANPHNTQNQNQDTKSFAQPKSKEKNNIKKPDLRTLKAVRFEDSAEQLGTAVSTNTLQRYNATVDTFDRSLQYGQTPDYSRFRRNKLMKAMTDEYLKTNLKSDGFTKPQNGTFVCTRPSSHI